MSVGATSAATRTDARAVRTGRVVAALVVALALVGVVVAAGLVVSARARPLSAEVGEPLTTAAGAFTLTRVETTFVPSTQGPPTAAKMAGTEGTEQLQVWVELAATGGRQLPFAEDQFRLVAADGATRAPDGSTLEEGTLHAGASITGQLWFDEVEGLEGSRLEYTDPAGRLVRVPLVKADEAPSPTRSGGHGHG